MLSTRRWTATLLAGALLCATGTLSGQSPTAAECVNGEAGLTSGASAAARSALTRLRWRDAHADFTGIQAKSGTRAAFDSIVARSEALLSATTRGEATPLDTAVGVLLARLQAARRELAAHLANDSLRLKSSFDMSGLEMERDLQVAGRAHLGFDVDVDFDSVPDVASAICASAGAAHAYVRYLLKPQFTAIANSYADASSHWEMFVNDGYSMTFLERMAASCRFGSLLWIVSPLRNCSTSPDRSLEPPRNQVVFAHPSAALAPLFTRDSLWREMVIVEWYGLMHHEYGPTRMRTVGASVAWSYPPAGRSRPGVVLRTPWGALGAFDRGAGKVFFAVSSDVLVHVPAVRNAARMLKVDALRRATSTIAEK